MGPPASGDSGRRRRMPSSDLSRLVDGGWVDRGPDDVRGLVDNRLHCSASFGRAPLGLGFAAAVIPPEAEGDREVKMAVWGAPNVARTSRGNTPAGHDAVRRTLRSVLWWPPGGHQQRYGTIPDDFCGVNTPQETHFARDSHEADERIRTAGPFISAGLGGIPSGGWGASQPLECDAGRVPRTVTSGSLDPVSQV
jgi:hypothetical protein